MQSRVKAGPPKNGTNRPRKNVRKRQSPMRRTQQSFFEYVFQAGPNCKACLHGAIRIGLSKGIFCVFFRIGGRGPKRGRATATGPASWCAAYQPVAKMFAVLVGIGGCEHRRGSATATHNAKGEAHNAKGKSNRVSSNMFFTGVLTERLAFTVRSASACRGGSSSFFSGLAAVGASADVPLR